MGFLSWLDGSAPRRLEARRAAYDQVAGLAVDSEKGIEDARLALGDDDLQIRIAATKALGRSDRGDARALLAEHIFGPDQKLRWWAFSAYADASGREGWPIYLRAAEDESHEIRSLARTAITKHSGPGDVAELSALAERLGRSGKRYRTGAQYLDSKSG